MTLFHFPKEKVCLIQENSYLCHINQTSFHFFHPPTSPFPLSTCYIGELDEFKWFEINKKYNKLKRLGKCIYRNFCNLDRF